MQDSRFRGNDGTGAGMMAKNNRKTTMRIGHGFDIHRFVADKPLMLGGILIPFPQGMLGHSDGDVVLHAICDALLGAAALGDIGQHFPDTDQQWHCADSSLFLRHINELIHQHNFSIQNIDVTIVAQVPKLAPYLDAMAENITHHLNIARNQVNIKATTMERLGPIGEEKAIAAHAVTLLKSILTQSES
jgi:2-C-methyl-D-erythritol 2,4-cyclodiphosphate synthase